LGENAPDKVLRTIYANLESLKKRGDEFAMKIMEKLRLIVSCNTKFYGLMVPCF
jgi:diacylglycerol kinase (ATP)